MYFYLFESHPYSRTTISSHYDCFFLHFQHILKSKIDRPLSLFYLSEVCPPVEKFWLHHSHIYLIFCASTMEKIFDYSLLYFLSKGKMKIVRMRRAATTIKTTVKRKIKIKQELKPFLIH